MRVSQLLYVMNKHDHIRISDFESKRRLYLGKVKDIAKDSLLNNMRILTLGANNDLILVLATFPKEVRNNDERRNT